MFEFFGDLSEIHSRFRNFPFNRWQTTVWTKLKLLAYEPAVRKDLSVLSQFSEQDLHKPTAFLVTCRHIICICLYFWGPIWPFICQFNAASYFCNSSAACVSLLSIFLASAGLKSSDIYNY